MRTYISLFFFAAVFTLIGTGIFRYIAIRLKIVDRVNSRSLHNEDKPRGGGLVIALCVTGAQIYILCVLGAASSVLWVWLIGGLVLASVGLMDDVTDLSEKIRLVVQVACACLITLTCWFEGTFEFGLITGVYITLFLFVIWCINAVNFMDGSDGLLASQTLIVSSSMAYLAHGKMPEPGVTSLVILGGASAGFIYWNWQPAKIFLGDVGSYFIGFQFAAAICLSSSKFNLTFVLLIMLTPMLADSSLTIMRRALGREEILQAHRTHIYQLLIQQGKSHAQVALYLGALSVFVYLPLAMLALSNPGDEIAIFAVGCLAATIIWGTIYVRIKSKERMT